MNRKIKFRARVPANSNEPKTMQYYDFINADDCKRFSESDFDINELMQFTGLQDKNGKDIYEGDIVLANGRKSFMVKDNSEARRFVNSNWKDEYSFKPVRSKYECYWQNNFSQFSFKSLDPLTSIDSDVSNRDLEIIGNIHETPELILN